MAASSNALDRRTFIKIAGLAAPIVSLAACAPQAASPTAMPMEGGNQQGGGSNDDMDAMHEQGVKTFLDGIGKDTAFWGTPLTFTMKDGFKVFEVTAQDIEWTTTPGVGKTGKAMAYNGIIPGPEIRVTEGDNVRVVVKNEMAQSTCVHFHGVLIPNNMDGVPFITQPLIKPGATFTYEFTARNPGTHMYHSHHNAAEQVTKGLLGAFIIEPKDKSGEPVADAEYTMVLNDSGIGISINGRGFPYTQPIVAKKGDKVRIRYMNEGVMIHPMHLHGLQQLVFAKDGWPLPAPYYCDTLIVGPGERYDVVVDCHTEGAWAFHCHILTHAESDHGMFGMVTALVVK